MDWEVVAVLLPVGVAIWLDRRRERLTKEQIAKQIKLAEEQMRAEAEERAKQQRATITVRQGTIHRGSPYSEYKFIVTNIGPAAASYVSLVLVLEETNEELAPRQNLPELMPGDHETLTVAIRRDFADNPRSVIVIIAWTDLTGTHQERKGSPMSF
jgi:hypothetical protein